VAEKKAEVSRSFSPAPQSILVRAPSPSILARSSSPAPVNRRDSFSSSIAGSSGTGETSTSIVDVSGWTDKAAFERWRSVRKSVSIRFDEDSMKKSEFADALADVSNPLPKARYSTPVPQPNEAFRPTPIQQAKPQEVISPSAPVPTAPSPVEAPPESQPKPSEVNIPSEVPVSEEKQTPVITLAPVTEPVLEEKLNVAFAPSPRKPSQDRLSAARGREKKSDPEPDLRQLARRRSSSLKADPIKAAATESETRGRTPTVRPKSPFQRSSSASKRLNETEAKRAAIEAARSKPLFEPVVPKRGLTRAPSRKHEQPPAEWDESMPALPPKLPQRIATAGKKVPGLNLSGDSNGTSSAAKSSPPGSLTRGSSARSGISTAKKSSPSDQSKAKSTVKAVPGKSSPRAEVPKKTAPAAPSAAMVPRPSPAQRAAERARLEREQTIKSGGALTPRGTKSAATSKKGSTSTSTATSALVSTATSAMPSRIPSSAASVSSQAAIFSDTPFDSTATSHRSSISGAENNSEPVEQIQTSTPTTYSIVEQAEIAPQDLSSDINAVGASEPIYETSIPVESNAMTMLESVDSSADAVDDGIIKPPTDLSVGESLEVIELSETANDLNPELSTTANTPVVEVDEALGQESVSDPYNAVSPVSMQTLDLSSLSSPTMDELHSPAFSQSNEKTIAEYAAESKASIDQAFPSRVQPSGSMPSVLDANVRVVDLSNATPYMQRRLNRAQSNASMVSEDQDNKSVYSIESFSTNHDSSVYGAPHKGDDDFEFSLLITPDRIVNTSLPSVKETITSFERMIMKKRYAQTTNEGHGNKKWSDKKFREY
jgi:hypothetical protein